MSIEEFFSAIRDGAWHSIDALSAQLAIPPSKIIEFSEFLSSRGILEYEKKTKKIRIDSKWKHLLPIEEIPA